MSKGSADDDMDLRIKYDHLGNRRPLSQTAANDASLVDLALLVDIISFDPFFAAMLDFLHDANSTGNDSNYSCEFN